MKNTKRETKHPSLTKQQMNDEDRNKNQQRKNKTEQKSED